MRKKSCYWWRMRWALCTLMLVKLSMTAVCMEKVSVRSHRELTTAGVVDTTYSAADMLSVVMSNCSSALTLTAACRNTSSPKQWPFLCVGSTTTGSCPQSPAILLPVLDADTGYTVDASGMGIERIAVSYTESYSVYALNIQNNRLTKLPYTNHLCPYGGGWCQLRKLQAAQNRFASLDAIELSPQLTHLNLSHNPLTRMTLTSANAKLESIDATNTSLVELQTSDVTNLLTLLAPYNGLRSLTNVTLPSRLRVLDLAHNQIDDWSGFKPPRGLRMLNASYNNATTFVRGNWSAIATKLQIINFSHNSLTTVSGIAYPASLEELDLQANPLEYFEIFASQVPLFMNLRIFRLPQTAAAQATNETCQSRDATTTAVRVANNVVVCVAPDRSDLDSPSSSSSSSSSSGSSQLPIQTPASSSSPSSSSSGSVWLIVGTAVVLLFALLAAFAWMIRRRRSHTGSKNGHWMATSSSSLSSKAPTGESLYSTQVTHAIAALRSDPSLVACRINASTDATVLRVLHESHSYQTSLVRVGERVMVCRQLQERAARLDEENAVVLSFIQEIQTSALLDFPKIVQCHGFSCSNSAMDLAIYSEYMSRGSLDTLLLKHQSTSFSMPWLPSAAAAVSRLDLAIDIAEALVYLHSFDPPVVHGNIRAKNVLLNDQWTAKLTRVGGQRLPRASSHSTLAPQVENAFSESASDFDSEHKLLTPETDVYAFGLLLCELDLQQLTPCTGLQQPRFTADCPPEVRALALSCLSTNPNDRPSAMKLSYDLSKLRKRAAGLASK